MTSAKPMTSDRATADTSDREIVVTRVFDALCELVFKAWTDPQHLAHWWGPNAFSVTTHEMEFKPGYGHGGLPDRDKIKDMYDFTRALNPRHLTWELTDAVLTDHFWLAVAKPGKGQSIDATIHNGDINVTTRMVEQFDLCLDSRLVTLDQTLRIKLDGTTQVLTARPKLATLCESMLKRGDPQMAYTCQIRLDAAQK